MKKSIILIGILLAVVIAMVGYYFMNKKQEGFQDQLEFEEVDIPEMDNNTEYIIKLTGVGTENNGIVRYISRYRDNYLLVDKPDSGLLFAVIDKNNNFFNLRDSINGHLFGFYDPRVNEIPYKFQDYTGRYKNKLKFFLEEKRLVNEYPPTTKNYLGFKNETLNFNTEDSKTEVSFIKLIRQRPEQGFYRIKITSLGTDNSDHPVSYLGYRHDNRYIITEDELQSTVFELIHDDNDNETFRLKNTGSKHPGRFFGEADEHHGDQGETNPTTYFKYNTFGELYNKHTKDVIHTNQKNTDKNLMHIDINNSSGRRRVKSKITFEKVEPAEEPEEEKIYKIKLTPVGNPHKEDKSEFKYGRTYYIASETTTGGYLKATALSDVEHLFFKIDKMLGSNRFLMYPCDKNGNEIRDNEDSHVAIIRRGSDYLYLDKSGTDDYNVSNYKTFSYNTYSKMLELPLDNNRRLCLHRDDQDGRIQINKAPNPTFIDHYRTLVEFEEYTPPAQTTTSAPPAPTTTTSAPPAQTTTSAPPAQTTTSAPPAQTTTSAPPATGTTSAPAEMGVRSKVKMTPDIRDYINSELNKYTDGSSLPTPEQIEQLSKIVGNHTAEELAKIPNLLNNFKDNTQNYMDFHKSYEEQLEEILRTKFDAEIGANKEIQDLNAKRLERLREEVRKHETTTTTSENEEQNNSLSYGSLRNIGNGTMLNFDKTADSNYVVLNMKGEKMVRKSNGLYEGKGEIQGCLNFDSTNQKLGTSALNPCNINNEQAPELSFKVRKIENIKEYNKLLTEIAPETKYLASEYDTINYPFHVVEPQNSPGFCVSVDDNKVRVLPCEKNSNQRYRKMNYQVKNDCGQNNNATQS